MELLFRNLLRRRAIVLALVAVSVLVASWGASQLRFDAQYRDIFRSNSPRYATFRQLMENFDAGENTLYVMFESNDVLSRESLELIRAAHTQIDTLTSTDSVVSIFDIRRTGRLGIAPLFPIDITQSSDDRIANAAENAMNHPLVSGRMVSHDRQATIVAVRLANDRVRTNDVAAAVAEIRSVVGGITSGTTVRSGLTGLPVIRVETVQSLERDNLGISLAGALLATVATWCIFRNVGAVFVIGVPPLVGVAWTLGAAGYVGHTLGTFDIVVPALLIVIGDSDAIHLLSRMRKQQAANRSSSEAAVEAFVSLGPACLLTSLTTAIGFGSLAICDDEMVRTFGIYAATGVALTFVSVILLVPLLGSIVRVGVKSMNGEHQASVNSAIASGCGEPLNQGNSNAPLHVLAQLFNWVERRPRMIAVAGIVLAIGLTAVAFQLRSDWAFLENLSDSSKHRDMLQRFEEKFGGMPLMHVIVEWPDTMKINSPSVLDVLQDVHETVEQNSAATSPFSILTVVDSLQGNTRNLARRIIRSPELSAIVRRNKRRTVVIANVPDHGAASLTGPLLQLEQRLSELRRRHPGFKIELSGFAVLGTFRTRAMLSQLVRSLGVASLVIFVVIVIALRSIRLGLASIVPNLLPLVATAAALVALNVPLQFASVLAFSICLGIAVDDTIHFLSRYRYELSRHKNPREAVRDAFESVAPAVVATTVILMLGFGAALLTTLPTVQIFGGLSCIALLGALVGDLVLLPAILLTIFQTRQTFCSREPNARASGACRGIESLVEPEARVYGSHRRITQFRITAHHLKIALCAGHTAAWLFFAWNLSSGGELVALLFAAIPLIMTIHQLEENVLTELALGPDFAFLRWVRTVGLSISLQRALALNCGVAWTLAVSAAVLGARYPWFALFVLQVEAVNGIWHVATAIRTRRWSPGILSSICVTIPAAAILTVWLFQSDRLTPTSIFLSVTMAIVSHAIFLRSLPKAVSHDRALVAE